MKQVIVLRNDLNMRKGKMIAQGAHAAVQVVFDFLGKDLGKTLDSPDHSWHMGRWFDEGMKKICVHVDSEAELLAVVEQAKAACLLVAPIRDAGHTEFHGVPTWTCCAIGPGPDEEIDKITGGLKLL